MPTTRRPATGREVGDNPLEPRRSSCPTCEDPVLIAYVHDQAVTLDPAEVRRVDGEPEPPGLYVAIGAEGDGRPIRLPGGDRRPGEALYRPHRARCRP